MLNLRNFMAIILGAFLCAGCVHSAPPKPVAKKPTRPIVTPDLRAFGHVEMINPQARFIVASFPLGRVPKEGARVSIKHNGLKIGEAKVTGPQHDSNTVADLLDGNAFEGDEVEAE
jgi:PBP1b-binding outer membrane lipoprotein LpoB